MAANLIFAAVYQLQPGAVANTTRGYLDYLFFSIETLSTVGYGYMYPVTVYAHIVASVEIFIGLLSVALVTGLMFARAFLGRGPGSCSARSRSSGASMAIRR